jgi:anti-sigma factor RsiW
LFNAIKRYFRKGEFDCDDVADHSSAYIDNDLKPDKRSAFQAHLSKCGPCQAFVGTLSSTIGALGATRHQCAGGAETIAVGADAPGKLILTLLAATPKSWIRKSPG